MVLKSFLAGLCCVMSALFASCVYDPPYATIKVYNTGKEAIYFYDACADTLPCWPEMRSKVIVGENSFDAKGNKIIDSFYHPNRIGADSFGFVIVGGSPENPALPCDEGEPYSIFIIREQVLQSTPWSEICRNGLYEKRLVLTNKMMDSLKWELVLTPGE